MARSRNVLLPFSVVGVSLVRAKRLGGEAGSKAGKTGSDKRIDGSIVAARVAGWPGSMG